MNLNTAKATVVKVDNNAYHSFNAYTRPKRVNSDYRRHPNARVINLDPTNDPDEICNAYRDIQIKAQLKRIAKNEQRLAERRRIAEYEAAAAKSRAELAAIRKAANQRVYRLNSALTKRRDATLARMKKGGFLLAPESASMRNAAILDIAVIRQNHKAGHQGKIDLVSITSVSVNYEETNTPLSIWGIDDFKRPPKRLYSVEPITRREELKCAILDALNKGYVVQIKDINAAITSIRGAVSALRKEGVMVCTVRNPDVDTQARGWVIPSALNGITSDKFFSMTDAQKA